MQSDKEMREMQELQKQLDVAYGEAVARGMTHNDAARHAAGVIASKRDSIHWPSVGGVAITGFMLAALSIYCNSLAMAIESMLPMAVAAAMFLSVARKKAVVIEVADVADLRRQGRDAAADEKAEALVARVMRDRRWQSYAVLIGLIVLVVGLIAIAVHS